MYLASEDDLKAVLKRMEVDIGNCLYLYIDIMKYGLTNQNMKVWLDKREGESSLIVMKYYNSMQVYAWKDDWSLEELSQLIEKEAVKMISAPKKIIECLMQQDACKGIYEAAYGNVFLFSDYREIVCGDIIVPIAVDRAEEAAQLMCMDEAFAENYQVDDLASQLKERIETGMGRSYGIYKDGKMIAHIATFAEESMIAVTSGLIVHPDYRGFPYGTVIESYLVNQLQKEGFRVFTFVNEKKRIKWMRALMCEECGEYGKLTMKELRT